MCYPNINFEEYLKKVKKVIFSGIDIKELNTFRKRYSRVGGGKLAKLTKAKIISLIFSDVIGNDLGTIASGPTYDPKLKNVDNILLLKNQVALNGMKKKAKSLNLRPITITNKLKGDAGSASKKVLDYVNKHKNSDCFLFAGETTVNVKGEGKGGRSQEFCLAAIENISKADSVMVSVGSDGRDGPTDAAGAIVDLDLLVKTRKMRLNYKRYLENNDAYHFFKKTKGLVFTENTEVNVSDIGVVVRL